MTTQEKIINRPIDCLGKEKYYSPNIDFDDKISIGVKIISGIIAIIFVTGLGTIIWEAIQLIKMI